MWCIFQVWWVSGYVQAVKNVTIWNKKIIIRKTNATDEPVKYECLDGNDKGTNTMDVKGFFSPVIHSYIQTIKHAFLSGQGKKGKTQDRGEVDPNTVKQGTWSKIRGETKGELYFKADHKKTKQTKWGQEAK